MKRSIETEAKERQTRELRNAQLLVSAPPPLSLETFIADINSQIDASFELALSPTLNPTRTITFHLPRSIGIDMLFVPLSQMNVVPVLKVPPCHSTTPNAKATNFKWTWSITSLETAIRVFGERFQPRTYSSPAGICNFDPAAGPIGGGWLRPEVSEQSPVYVEYTWNQQQCSIRISFRKEEVDIDSDDDTVIFNALLI